MITPELQTYIDQMKLAGKNQDEIKLELARVGWPAETITSLFTPPVPSIQSMTAAVPVPVAAPPVTLQYQGIGIRFWAQFVDSIIWFSLFGYVIAVMVGQTSKIGFSLHGTPAMLDFALGFAYFVAFETIFGATPGKMLFKLKVVKEDGSKADFTSVLLRNLLRIVDGLPFLYIVGIIFISRSPMKQRFGDKTAHTVVIKTNSPLNKKIVIGSIVVLLLLLIGLQQIGSRQQKNAASVVSTSYTKNGTTFTNYQAGYTGTKKVTTTCFTSLIPDIAVIKDNECAPYITTPDTTMSFAEINAITEAGDAAYGAQFFKTKLDTDLKTDKSYLSAGGLTTLETKVDGQRAFKLTHSAMGINYVSYVIDVPKNSNYMASGKPVTVFIINGFNNDPTIDMFSKEYNLFMDNFKFR